MSKITMYSYLAEKVPADVHFTLNKYGKYDKAHSPEELELQIKDFVNSYGENGLLALAEIHPDRELIEKGCHSCKTKDDKINTLAFQNDMASNFVGQMPYFNATGESINEERVVNKMAINSIIVGGFVLMGIALMLKK
jgi:hypothetical protein